MHAIACFQEDLSPDRALSVDKAMAVADCSGSDSGSNANADSGAINLTRPSSAPTANGEVTAAGVDSDLIEEQVLLTPDQTHAKLVCYVLRGSVA